MFERIGVQYIIDAGRGAHFRNRDIYMYIWITWWYLTKPRPFSPPLFRVRVCFWIIDWLFPGIMHSMEIDFMDLTWPVIYVNGEALAGYDDFYRWILLFRNSRILFVRVFQKVEEKFWKIRLEMGKIVIQIHTRWGAKTMNYWRSYRKREQGIRNSRARGYSNRDFMRHRNFDHHAGTFPRIGQRLDCSLG